MQESEKERNARLYPWFTEIVNRYPRADVKAAWITDIETGEILAGRVPPDEYKTVEIYADQYFKLAAVAKYCGMTDAERKQHDGRVSNSGHRKTTRKVRHR